MSSRRESPLFVRLHDLVRWLLQTTRRFPRDQRFALAQRLVDRAFALEDGLIAATLADDPRASLARAEAALIALRRGLLLAFELGYLTDRQLGHVTSLHAEVGRLLGGWRNKTGRSARPAPRG